MGQVARRLANLIEEGVGVSLPLRIRAWDDSEAGAPDGPVLSIVDRRALRRILWKPSELGLARAWVAGEITVEGNLHEALERLTGMLEHGQDRDVISADRARDRRIRRLIPRGLALAGPGLPPGPPREEVRRRRGMAHSRRRDHQAISHHYDVGNEFYELVIGESMVYSCAYWNTEDGADFTLADAQQAKHDLVCRKLALGESDRLLDVGCGWGSMVLHAAEQYGAHAVGVTISEEQAEFARKRVAEAGLTDLVEVRVQDYRDIADGPYDAICSIGMGEHVGRRQYPAYADALYKLCKPGGRLLNHQIARRPLGDEDSYELDEFIDRYVFPDGELTPVGTTVSMLESAGFEVRDLQALREHYGKTLRAWVANLEANWAEAIRLATPARARIWRLYMAASALSFERNEIGVNQILAVRSDDRGASGIPVASGDRSVELVRAF